MKRVLVTGGAGFLGAHLCRRLVEDGNEVTCVDDLSTGFLDNIKDLIGRPGFKWIETCVKHTFDWKYEPGTVKTIAYDEIYNLACPASPKHYQRDPVKTTLDSIIAAKHVCQAAYEDGGKVLQASTSEIYGDPLEHPQREEHWGNVNPIGPRSCYDEGKRCAESIFMDYHRKHGTRIKIARIFNTYGPGMAVDDGRVVSNFIVQALRGEPITIYGDGTQTRSFCYVDDMIEGLVRLMATGDEVTGPVNLGNPVEISINDLVICILDFIGVKPNIVGYSPLPEDDPTRRRPDITRAKQLLDGWEPRVALESGIPRTIEYFRKKLGEAG